jgi:hypothetical protein
LAALSETENSLLQHPSPENYRAVCKSMLTEQSSTRSALVTALKATREEHREMAAEALAAELTSGARPTVAAQLTAIEVLEVLNTPACGKALMEMLMFSASGDEITSSTEMRPALKMIYLITWTTAIIVSMLSLGAAAGVVTTGLMAAFFVSRYRQHTDSPTENILSSAILAALGKVDYPRAIPTLIGMSLSDKRNSQIWDSAIAPLLMKLGPEDCEFFTTAIEEAAADRLSMRETGHKVAEAILHALELFGTGISIPATRKFVAPTNETDLAFMPPLRARALLLLPILEARAIQGAEHGSLLRASSSSQLFSETLGRPVMDAAQDATELLHVSDEREA